MTLQAMEAFSVSFLVQMPQQAHFSHQLTGLHGLSATIQQELSLRVFIK